MSLCAAVVWNTSVTYTVDLILSTCVMKPDYHREDGLGISHSVTHRCSSEAARVHRIRRARRKGRTNREGGWDEEQEVVSERRERELSTESEKRQKMKIKYIKKREKRKEN